MSRAKAKAAGGLAIPGTSSQSKQAMVLNKRVVQSHVNTINTEALDKLGF